MYVCEYCGKEFNNKKSRASHYAAHEEYKIYKQLKLEALENVKLDYNFECICGSKHETLKNLCCHKAKCNIFKNNKQLYLSSVTQEILELYNTYSVIHIRDLLRDRDSADVSWKDISNIIVNNNVHIRNIKEAANMPNCIDARELTNIQRYNSTNVFSKDSTRYSYVVNRRFESYGCDNIFRTDWFKNNLENFYFDKYGDTLSAIKSKKGKEVWALKTDEERLLWLGRSIFKNNPSRISILETTFFNYIEEILNVKIKRQFYYNGKFFDGYIEECNLIIEINGDYWHANPKKYRADDLLSYPGGVELKAEEVWQRDLIKHSLITKYFDLLVIWENDIKRGKYEYATKLIKNKIYKKEKNY